MHTHILFRQSINGAIVRPVFKLEMLEMKPFMCRLTVCVQT